MIFCYVPCKDAEEAKRIARLLIERKAAACVNILPATSLWCDNGGVTEATEAVMIAKTTEEKIGAVEEIVRANHSYRTPCIASFSMHRLNREYKEWLAKCLMR